MLLFKQTCVCSPEQYDIIDNNQKIGYCRLRHGIFTVNILDKEIFRKINVNGKDFFEENERSIYINHAAELVLNELGFNLTKLYKVEKMISQFDD